MTDIGDLFWLAIAVCVLIIAACLFLVGAHHELMDWLRAHRRQRKVRGVMVDLTGRDLR